MYNILKELKEKRKDYASMIDFCCDSLVLNNSIMTALQEAGYTWEIYCGSEYEEEQDEDGDPIYKDFYQYYIISDRDAERLAEYTKEVVYYIDALDLYVLAVDHFGTPWAGVPANWKEEEEG